MKILLTIAFIFIPLIAQSQTHYCDTIAPTTQTITSSIPVKIQFCAKPIDVWEGVSVIANAVTIYNGSFSVVGVPSPLSSLQLYELPARTWVRGNYSLFLRIYKTETLNGVTSIVESVSNPFSLIVTDIIPPVALTTPIIRGTVR